MNSFENVIVYEITLFLKTLKSQLYIFYYCYMRGYVNKLFMMYLFEKLRWKLNITVFLHAST